MEARRKTRIDRLTADREEIPENQNHTLTEEGLLMEGDTSGLTEVCVGRNPEPCA
jgi:hypothetical protein